MALLRHVLYKNVENREQMENMMSFCEYEMQIMQTNDSSKSSETRIDGRITQIMIRKTYPMVSCRSALGTDLVAPQCHRQAD